MKKIIIIGAGGFGREVEMLIRQINSKEPIWNLIGFLDDGIGVGTSIGNSTVLGGVESISNYENTFYVIAIADSRTKQKILSKIPHEILPATLIHPSVICGSRVNIGAGTIICAGTIITEDIIIGNQVILNLSCTVGHDTIIKDLSSFMPSVNISGEVTVEKGVFVGTGSKIINQVEIGEFSIIGAGAVVSKSIPPKCTAVGVPAKPIKFHE